MTVSGCDEGRGGAGGALVAASAAPAASAGATADAVAHAATYDRHSGPLEFDAEALGSPDLIEAQLRKSLHRVEKGLSLANPRRPFGESIERDLVQLLRVARETAGGGESFESAIAQAERALTSLRLWNETGQLDDLSGRPAQVAGPFTGAARDAVKSFFEGRNSTRSFAAGKPVSDADMNAAIETALASPSVCNRATGRVHLYHGAEMVAKLFALQQGNRGLDGVEHVAIVTTSLPMFTGTDEFVQPWIDGGIFAMNLVWGFEQRGIATCFLNWSMPHAASTELRAVAGIPEDELVITLIAFGHPAGDLRVTASEKPPLETVVTRHP